MNNYPAGITTDHIDALCVEEETSDTPDEVVIKYMDALLECSFDRDGALESVDCGGQSLDNILSSDQWKTIEKKCLAVYANL